VAAAEKMGIQVHVGGEGVEALAEVMELLDLVDITILGSKLVVAVDLAGVEDTLLLVGRVTQPQMKHY